MPEPVEDKKVAIVGGGPTGIAAAYFLGREGVPTTIFERERKLGGVPRYVIPAFRILSLIHISDWSMRFASATLIKISGRASAETR